ncbi:restriction endonuclease subunit S [Escherichia coli]
MSELNYLEKLLDGTEVEWKALGDVTSVLRGKRLTKNLLSAEEKFPVFHGGLEPLGYYNKSNRPANTVMIINVGASAGTVGYSTVDFWSSDGCFCLEHNELLNNRFLYFALIGYQSLLKSKVRVAGIPTLDAIVVNKLLIPIPCPENPEKSLAIQSKIVRILDRFSALTAELTAELNMRKKQYNYYRDQLLNLEGRENTREMRIGDIYDFQYGTGNTIPKSGGQYPVYGSNGIVGSHDKYNSEDSPVIGHIGAYAGIVNWGQGKHFVTYNGVICRHKSKEVLQKYAYYLLLLQDFGSKSNSASQPFVSYNILNAPIVLVPPLQEQARIVAILDKFDTLTNSITEGLPREIELRQKQYEYYRDLLFNFPKPETVSK